MIHPVTRVYASAQQATEAAAQLKASGFTDDLVTLITPANAASTADGIATQIMAGYVLKARAKIHAEEIKRGASLVSVQAPFGMGGAASDILDSFAPVESAAAEGSDTTMRWDDAAPISSALRIPAIVDGDPTFSGFWSMPVLSKRGRTLCSLLGLPEVSGSGKTTFGGLLTSSSLSFSSKLGLPLLIGGGSRR